MGMDAAEYQQAVLSHKDRVYSFAAHVLSDREEARDIAQEALVRLWTNLDRVEPEAAKAWLMKTTHHLCVDRVRQRRTRAPAPALALETLHDGVSTRPDRRAGSRQIADRIWEALSALTPKDRSLLLLREVHGMAYEEMAETLAIPLGTLKAALHRARERCRQELIGLGVEP